MLLKETRRAFIIVSILLVIIVLAFTGSLNAASFKKMYTNSLVASYSVVGTEYVRKIEYAVKYGKSLANFFGLTELLAETKRDCPGMKNIEVVLRDGKIVADLSGKNVKRQLPPEFQKQNSFSDSNDRTVNSFLLENGLYHVFLPIHDRDNHWIGSMELIFEEALVKSKTGIYLRQMYKASVMFGILALLILILIITKIKILNQSGEIRRKLILSIIFIVLSLLQIGFGWINFGMFKKVYLEVTMDYTSKIAAIIQQDINGVIDKGVIYQDLNGIETWLKRFMVFAPEIDQIYLTDRGNKLLYTTFNGLPKTVENSQFLYKMPLQTDRNQQKIDLNIILSQKYINGKFWGTVMDMLTVLVTSFFFMIELTLFLIVFLGRRKNSSFKESLKDEVHDQSVVRPLGFVLFFAAFLSQSFIPLLMKDLYQPIPGLAENVVLGLPISTELLCGAIAALLAGYAIMITGWKPAFFLGLTFFALGACLSGTAHDAFSFIIARGVFGLGYGFCLVAMHGFINSSPSIEAKNKGISILNAGLFAGINCGCVLGAIIAERIGYAKVFFITFHLAILAGVVALFFMKNRFLPCAPKKGDPQSKVGLVRFLFDRSLAPFILLMVIPFAAGTMFLEYFLPLFSKEVGISAPDIGRVFLVNGLAVIYLGPLLSKLLGKYYGVKTVVILEAVVIVMALLVFGWSGNFGAAFIAAFLLGIAVGFGDAAQNNYLLGLKISRELGEGRAIGIFNMITKMGQTIGPVIFGLATISGSAQGVGFVGLGLAGFMVLFILFTSQRILPVQR